MGGHEEVDVVKAAEAYFKKFNIRSLLTQLLVKLGREQPDDPVNAIRNYLDSQVVQDSANSKTDIKDHLASSASPDEEHDADDSLLQAGLGGPASKTADELLI